MNFVDKFNSYCQTNKQTDEETKRSIDHYFTTQKPKIVCHQLNLCFYKEEEEEDHHQQMKIERNK